MDEMYRKIKSKLEEMRKDGKPITSFSYEEVSRLYQLVCMMKQIKEIADWCDNGYS